MKVESNTTGVRPASAPTASADRAADDWISEPTAVNVLSRLPALSDRFIASAPGRLDLMGGLAEYSGSSVANLPIGGRVWVAVESVEADEVSIHLALPGQTSRKPADPVVIPLSKLFTPDGSPIDPEPARRLVDQQNSRETWCVFAALLEMFRSRVIPRLDHGGLAIAAGSTLTDVTCAAEDTALVAATVVALGGLQDITLDRDETPAFCQRVANNWLDLPIGISDAFCVLHGEPNTLREIECTSRSMVGSIRIPRQLTVIGLDCGVVHPDVMTKYVRARTASFMGLGLIDRIMRHEGSGDSNLNGSLAQVSVADFVGRFRDRIPRKLKGSEYLQRFGETGDRLTQIDPKHVYKIRSRTEHHVYEHQRVRRFFECMRRVAPGSEGLDEKALTDAGEFMYASHWSYGQRCGLGNIETDLLVNLIRKHGTGAGVYGAKITGRGCGGVVAVLMKATDQAREAIDTAVRAYESETKYKVTVLRSTASGAMINGARNAGTASRR